MRFNTLHKTLLAGVISLVAMQGCKKVSEIGRDNNIVITTPYTVYAVSNEGWIVRTNDGRTFNHVFPPDGYPTTMISAAGENVIVKKSRIFYSDNQGKNFNPSAYMNFSSKPWRNWVLDCPSHERTYMASTEGNGVAVSLDGGKTWEKDSVWEANVSPNVKVSSFAQLSNGSAYAFADDDNVLFKRDNATSPWNHVLIQSILPSLSGYFLVANTSELFVVDHQGLGSTWYSIDQGANWVKIPDGELPRQGLVKMTGAASGSPGTVAVCTEDNIYYGTKDNGFVRAIHGLEIGTKIYSMTAKYNVYKNGNRLNFLYVATSKGIYRSDDSGYNWDKVTFNEYDTDYRAIY